MLVTIQVTIENLVLLLCEFYILFKFPVPAASSSLQHEMSAYRYNCVRHVLAHATPDCNLVPCLIWQYTLCIGAYTCSDTTLQQPNGLLWTVMLALGIIVIMPQNGPGPDLALEVDTAKCIMNVDLHSTVMASNCIS